MELAGRLAEEIVRGSSTVLKVDHSATNTRMFVNIIQTH